jgi:Zn-dependent M28 family amino/carboxypeptidase
MVSLDMIAYNNGSNGARIYGRDSSNPFKNSLADAVEDYGNGLTTSIFGALDASDHAPFEWQGFQAALLIEYGVTSNPYYHKAADSVDTLNYIDYAFATNMVCSTVGFFADNAVLIPEPASMIIIIIGAAFVRLKRKAA